jgi:hypothetical protein
MDLDTPIQIVTNPSVILAVIFIVIASQLRRKSVEAKKNWDKSWDPIPPSLKESPAAMVTARRGVTGCATWILNRWILFPIFVALSIDFALFQGEATTYVGENLDEWLRMLGDSVLSFLRQLARAVL